MGRIIGGVDFADKTHKTVSKILAKSEKPFPWSQTKSFSYDFFDLLKISPPANSTPCFSDQKDLFIFFDGEIIIDDIHPNRGEPAKENISLINKLIAIYLERGPENLCGLNGMYLIVVWDKKLKTLYITNDVLGLKPCYYWLYDKQLFFGTQYEFLTHHPSFSKDIHNEAILDLMIMGCVLEDRTLFKNIKCLQPGCLLTCKDGYINVQKHSQLEFSDSRWGFATSQLVEEMTSCLGQSIEKRIKNSKSTLVPLSGGLDSRTLAGFCKKYCSNLTTLSYGLKKHTDVKIARRVAKNLNIPHTFVHQGADFLIKYADLHLDITESSAELITVNIMPVLKAAQDKYQDIVVGYPGDGLHGENFTVMIKNMKNFGVSPVNSLFDKCYAKRFSPKDMTQYLSNDLKKLADNPGNTVKKFFNDIDGNILHKCLLTDLYYRYRHYISSQLNLLEDCARIHAPFTDLNYLNFILSLPPIAFENKYLYLKMIETSFPEIAHLSNTYTNKPFLFSKKSIAHKISLSLEIRKDFIFEIPKQLIASQHPQIKSSMWDTFSCVDEPYRLHFGKILRGLYEYLEQFFNIDTVDNLFFSKNEENPLDQGARMRRLIGFALWLKRYFA